MRWKLLIAAGFILAAPALDGAAAAARPQGARTAHSDDREPARKARPDKAERHTARDRDTSAKGAGSPAGREREEHDRDDD